MKPTIKVNCLCHKYNAKATVYYSPQSILVSLHIAKYTDDFRSKVFWLELLSAHQREMSHYF